LFIVPLFEELLLSPLLPPPLSPPVLYQRLSLVPSLVPRFTLDQMLLEPFVFRSVVVYSFLHFFVVLQESSHGLVSSLLFVTGLDDGIDAVDLLLYPPHDHLPAFFNRPRMLLKKQFIFPKLRYP
jgi:hypothetical protein